MTTFPRIADKLAEFEALPDGWDSYGGKAPSREVTDLCRALLASLPPGTEEPHVSASGAGSVQLEWESPNGRFLELEATPGGWEYLRGRGEVTEEGKCDAAGALDMVRLHHENGGEGDGN